MYNKHPPPQVFWAVKLLNIKVYKLKINDKLNKAFNFNNIQFYKYTKNLILLYFYSSKIQKEYPLLLLLYKGSYSSKAIKYSNT